MVDPLLKLAELQIKFGFYRDLENEANSNREYSRLQGPQGIDDRSWEELITLTQLLYLKKAKNHLRTIKYCAIFFVVLTIIIIVSGIVSFFVLSNGLASFLNEISHSTSSHSYYY